MKFNEKIVKFYQKIKSYEKDKKKALILSAVATLILMIFVIGATFAYFKIQGNSSASADFKVLTATTDLLSFNIDKGINLGVTQSDFKKGSGNKSDSTNATATLTASNSINVDKTSRRYNIYLVIESNDFEYTTDSATPELLLKVTDPNGNEVENITGLVSTENGFDITTRTGGFLIIADYDIEATRGKNITQNWNVEITFVNLDTDQLQNMGKTLTGKLYLTQEKMSSYELTEINSVEPESTYNSITASLNITDGTAQIDKYYFGIEKVSSNVTGYVNKTKNKILRLGIENVTFVETNKPYYTFKNLEENATYKVYSYGVDKNKIKTNIYETEIKTNEYTYAKVNSITSSVTLNSIVLTANATKGDNDIVKYYYSKDNGATYEESTSNSHVFSGLNDTTEYKIKVKVLDSLGRYSTEYFEAITTETYILPVVASVTPTTKWNQISVSVIGTNGTNNVSKYYYSIDNGEYIESTNASYVFTDLNEKTTHTIKVKVSDTQGRMSKEYTLSATTDAYKVPTITNVTTSSTSSSVTINVTGKNGDGTITKYYYSKDNGSNYIESTSNSYTFSDLTSNTTFYLKVYVKDNSGRISSEYETSKLTDYVLPKVNSFTYTATSSSLTITASATKGSADISKYLFSIDNGATYNESAANTYTFSNLSAGTTYTIMIKVQDSLNKESEVYSNTGKTNTLLLAEYIKSKYTSQGSNGLYHHDGTLTNGIDDNSYRYSGASPNNYVCFGSTDATCPTDNLYRIIGVFGEQVKLIKSTSIGSMAWDSNNKNTWSTASLNTYLNGTYLTSLGTYASKIAQTTWKVGSNTSANIRVVIPSVTYQNEIVNPVTTNTTDNVTTFGPSASSKIGLMYVSDYGFAADPAAWTTTLYNYSGSVNGSTIKSLNWMNIGASEWTISRNADYSNGVFYVSSSGYVDRSVARTSGAVRPVFYLESSATYSSGDGASDSPIRLG